MIIAILLLLIVVGVILAGIAAPFIVANDRKILREMREIVEDFGTIAAAYRDEKRPEYRKRLIALKAKIYPGHKSAVSEASDLLASV